MQQNNNHNTGQCPVSSIVVPDRIKRLPVVGGLPVPFFVAWLTPDNQRAEPGTAGARPEFRLVDELQRERAIEGERCWICGERLGRNVVFIGGPLVAINQVSADGPMHRDCAVFSATVCPFLSNPERQRNTEGLPQQRRKPGGVMLEHNPGLAMLWYTRSYKVHRYGDGRALWLLGEGEQVEWLVRGRAATRAEVLAALELGLPALREIAARENSWGMMEAALAEFRQKWLPSK